MPVWPWGWRGVWEVGNHHSLHSWADQGSGKLPRSLGLPFHVGRWPTWDFLGIGHCFPPPPLHRWQQEVGGMFWPVNQGCPGWPAGSEACFSTPAFLPWPVQASICFFQLKNKCFLCLVSVESTTDREPWVDWIDSTVGCLSVCTYPNSLFSVWFNDIFSFSIFDALYIKLNSHTYITFLFAHERFIETDEWKIQAMLPKCPFKAQGLLFCGLQWCCNLLPVQLLAVVCK